MSSSSPSSSKSTATRHSPLPSTVTSPPRPTAPVLAASASHSHASHHTPLTRRPSVAGAAITPHASPHPALVSADEDSSHAKFHRPTELSPSRSAPIPIPPPRLNLNAASSYKPTTPLTAREGKGAHFLSHLKIPAKPQLGRSITPRYAQHPHPGRHINHFSDDSDSPSSSVGSTGSMPRQRPSSPLSPSDVMPMSPLSPKRQPGNPQGYRLASRPTPKLRLNSLPRFHPANYESPSSGAVVTPRPSRPAIAQSHGRQASDTQSRLIQPYQRDIVINATRAAALISSPKTPARPVSPRLNPSLGSPGPMTPLILEGGEDYLTAGTLGSPDSQTFRGRELVQRLVDKENERRSHHSRSESHSPAVSPAGGRI